VKDRLRTLGLAAALLSALGGCSGGVNAGEEGGIAFIVFAVMLVLVAGVLYLALGRGE
jgi:hypothetical protein